MNQHDPKYYYYQRQDPFKLGYWDDEQPLLKEVSIGVITFIVILTVIFASIESVLFLN
jgi:hypothetical protein